MGTRKKVLNDRWVNADDFAQKIKDRDLQKDTQARELLSQVELLRSTYPGRYTRLVEVGSGDGKMLKLLSEQDGLEVIGSDLAGERLEQAKKDHPNLTLEEADLIKMARAYANPSTIFFAMNVLGNITERDLVIFLKVLERRGCALVFSARDLALDTEMLYLDRGMAFAYNYKELARRTKMTFFASLHRYRESGNQQGGLVATMIRRKQLEGSRVAEFDGKRIKRPLTPRVRLYRLARRLKLR